MRFYEKQKMINRLVIKYLHNLHFFQTKNSDSQELIKKTDRNTCSGQSLYLLIQTRRAGGWV